MRGILGAEPRLDRPAVDREVLLPECQRHTGGDLDLRADEVDAADHLRDRMLHLEARVHLEEVPVPLVQQELDAAGADVPDGAAQADRGSGERSPADGDTRDARTAQLLSCAGRDARDRGPVQIVSGAGGDAGDAEAGEVFACTDGDSSQAETAEVLASPGGVVPTMDKPVYCRECFQERRAMSSSYNRY